MKHYLHPDVELLYLATEDIIATSGGENDPDGDDIFKELP